MKLQIDELQQRIQSTVATVRARALEQGEAIRAASSRPQATVRRVIASGRSSLAKSADVAKAQVDQRIGALNVAFAKLAGHPVVQKFATSTLGAKLVARLPTSVSQVLTQSATEQTIQ